MTTETNELQENDPAPDFTLDASGGEKVSLHNLRGKPVVLYFYPKDDTPGCTKEACNFRDNMGTITKTGALVYGISPDKVAAHDKFSKKYELNFPLLSDTDTAVATAYGVWKEKSMYGKKFMGIERSTFLIDEEGKIAKIWRKVKVESHADQVLTFIQNRK
jgi:thioredoxin-dependent peroxiredoxin